MPPAQQTPIVIDDDDADAPATFAHHDVVIDEGHDAEDAAFSPEAVKPATVRARPPLPPSVNVVTMREHRDHVWAALKKDPHDPALLQSWVAITAQLRSAGQGLAPETSMPAPGPGPFTLPESSETIHDLQIQTDEPAPPMQLPPLDAPGASWDVPALTTVHTLASQLGVSDFLPHLIHTAAAAKNSGRAWTPQEAAEDLARRYGDAEALALMKDAQECIDHVDVPKAVRAALEDPVIGNHPALIERIGRMWRMAETRLPK
jgi:hypothetical protein